MGEKKSDPEKFRLSVADECGILLPPAADAVGRGALTVKCINIITAPLVEQLLTEGYAFPDEAVQYYPDGSIWSGHPRVLDGTAPQERAVGPGYLTASHFRSLAAFGGSPCSGCRYTLWFPGWYGDLVGKYDEGGALTYPGIAQSPTESEQGLASIRVVIRGYRKITEVVALDLAATLRGWFGDVASKGVFGEAGLRGISRVMHYQNRVAGFKMDARGSGQETVNTLYLAVLAWGMAKRYPLEFVADLTAASGGDVFSSQSTTPLD